MPLVPPTLNLALEEAFDKAMFVFAETIANSQPGNGNAKVILNQFFEWCPQNVYLSVRKDNLTACQFYDSIGMKLVGETSWAKGTIPGNVYIMKKSENVSK